MYIDSVNSKEGQFAMTLSDVKIVDATVANAKKTLLKTFGMDIGEKAYTEESLGIYLNAKEGATVILNNTQATEQDVLDATTALQQALNGLNPKKRLGDVNENGDITAEDALLALQAATDKIQLMTSQEQTADVDGNVGVTANDALMILQYATKKITMFA